MLQAGAHLGRCSGLIDLGTQTMTWPGSTTPQTGRRVQVTFTLIESDGKEARLSKEFKFSMSERAGFRKFIESWRGHPLTAEELEHFNPKKILDEPAMLNVSLKQGTDLKQRAQIAGIMRPPQGLQVPPLKYPPTLFSLRNPDRLTFKRLPTWIQTKIRQSQEWGQLMQQK